MFSVKGRFEWEYAEYLIAVACDLVYAPLFPCPYFRWDIVDYFGLWQVLLAVFGYFEVKGWVVY
jgi:hypothetical protein